MCLIVGIVVLSNGMDNLLLLLLWLLVPLPAFDSSGTALIPASTKRYTETSAKYEFSLSAENNPSVPDW